MCVELLTSKIHFKITQSFNSIELPSKAGLASIVNGHLTGLHKLIKVRQIGGNFRVWRCG